MTGQVGIDSDEEVRGIGGRGSQVPEALINEV
jgi:hypothetical protein